MAIKTTSPVSFTAYYVEKRKTKKTFLKQIDQLINWKTIQRVLERYYPKGQSNVGRKAYPALLIHGITWVIMV